MVLAGLEQLHIRALFSQTSSAVSLRGVALEVASEVGGGPPASNVELCMCPANYRGDSCQVRSWGRAPPAPSPRFIPHPLGAILPAALPSHHGPGHPVAYLSATPLSPVSLPGRPCTQGLCVPSLPGLPRHRSPPHSLPSLRVSHSCNRLFIWGVL